MVLHLFKFYFLLCIRTTKSVDLFKNFDSHELQEVVVTSAGPVIFAIWMVYVLI